MNIDEWIEQKNNTQDILTFIKENPDEIFEVLVHYQVNCGYYHNEYKMLKRSIIFYGISIFILLVMLLWMSINAKI